MSVARPWTNQPMSTAVEWLEQAEQARRAREDQMRNALEILAYIDPGAFESRREVTGFVRATAREGLGRE